MVSVAEPTVEVEYRETYAFLCSMDRFGILLGLENITQLLENLGNPQKTFPAVHVGGSNGKGSTSSFLTGILTKAGYKTSLYTSPHLNDFRERIRLNGDLVSKEAVIDATKRIKQVYDPARTTFFEFTTAVAFDCISRAKPDIGVIEVGLGGRLDATNTLDPILTIITDISREHEDYLGVGIKSVAGEKAGIIKKGVPLLTAATRNEAKQVILGKAAELEAPTKLFGRDFRAIRTGLSRFTYRSEKMELEDLRLAMAGGHQIKNAALACAAIEELREQGYDVSEDHIRNGIVGVRFPGRFEIVRRSPDVVIDGAHTPESVRLLKSTLRQHYPGVRPLVLMGMLGEKNYDEMARIIASIATEVVCVSPQGDRALDPEELAKVVRETGVPTITADTIEAGLRILLEKASENDLILAAGSLYMIGPVRRECGLQDR
ncbi:bifunctional folylpolyglutamate synthase/dihydrofolate synthase [Thermodesulfobacteriota bacterium]